MPITLNGDGAISGLTATGISAVQNLPVGSVLQVVNATYSTQTNTTSSTFSDTGLTATITPKFATSKILVNVNQNGVQKDTGNTWVDIKLLRNSTDLTNFCTDGAFNNLSTGVQVASASTSFLDSPATTSATTYKTQFRSGANISRAIVQVSSSASTITLMEIAQ